MIAAGLIVYYLAATFGHLLPRSLTHRLLVGIAGILLCVGYGIALGLFTSVMWPRAKDVRYLERYVLQLWMILTPIFYSYSALPHTYQVLAQLNPLTSILGMVQYGFVDAGFILPWGIPLGGRPARDPHRGRRLVLQPLRHALDRNPGNFCRSRRRRLRRR